MPSTPARGLAPAVTMGVLTLVCVCALGAVGQGAGFSGSSAAAGVLSAVSIILHAGLYALAYLLAAIGLGRLPAAVCAWGMESRIALQAALGVGMMLWVSHLLGCFGLLSGDGLGPRLVAWSVVGLGLVLLLDQMVRGELAPEKWPVLPWLAVFAAPAAATLLVASANAPGWLWESEFGAYDALSYHLQLPKEWAVGGLWPADHNVYSYLPGYVEAGYLHLAQMVVGGSVGGGGAVGVVERMLGGDGVWVYSCQMLHALAGVLGAVVCGRAAWAAAARCGAAGGGMKLAGVAVAVLVLSTGWMIACGSLAYNEMGVVLLSAGALLLCVDRAKGEGGAEWGRWMGIGLMVGLASSCKPTALLLAGPAAGLLMLGMMERRRWVGAIIAGSIGGMVAIAPWLARNALASGNPVFPFAAETLGLGHWTAEQAARYARSHAFDGTLIDRFALLFSARGWLHGQWGAMPWLALAAACIGLVNVRTHKLAAMLVGGIVCGLVAWMFFTHLQSRFLLPLIAPLAMLLGAGLAAAMPGTTAGAPPGARLRAGLLAYAIMALLLVLPWIAALGFLRERGGAPNALLAGGVAEFTGSLRADNVYLELTPQERAVTLREAAGPYELVNLAVRPAMLGEQTRAALLGGSGGTLPGEPGAVYLLGDATPLYYLGATGGADAGVVYHTTWDRSPLGDAIRARPEEPAAWTDALRGRGIGFVLINFDELDRLIEHDRYFDPDVTTARVRAWLADPGARCEVVKVWTVGAGEGSARPSRALVRLIRATGPTDKGGP